MVKAIIKEVDMEARVGIFIFYLCVSVYIFACRLQCAVVLRGQQEVSDLLELGYKWV